MMYLFIFYYNLIIVINLNDYLKKKSFFGLLLPITYDFQKKIVLSWLVSTNYLLLFIKKCVVITII